jgi:hypothetical protein
VSARPGAKVIDAGLRPQRVVGALAQQPERTPHLSLRLPRRPGDRVQGASGGTRILLGGVAAAVGLCDHDRERVGDHVVQLPSDACAFLGGRDCGLLVALHRERPRSLTQALTLTPAPSHSVAERRGEREMEHQHQPGDEDAGGAELVEAERERNGPGERDDEAGGGKPARRVGHQRIERNEDPAVRGEELIDEHELCPASQHHDREDRYW